MHTWVPKAIEIFANRLHCGSSQPHLYRGLYTLGSLSGKALENAIIDRLNCIYADHDPQKCAYYHGLWCEAHMAALMAVQKKEANSMQEIYAKSLQPEAALLKDLICPDALCIRFETEMTGALCGSANLRGAALVCAKLLEKCMCINGNHTESVRYIRAQFTKANESSPLGLAFLLCGCVILGTLPGATMCPPKVRIQFYQDPEQQIANFVETLPSRSLWFSLIVVVREACFRHPIFRMTRSKGGFAPQFDTDKVSIEKFTAVKRLLIPALQGDTTKTLTPTEIKRKNPKRKQVAEECYFEGVKHKRRLTENTVISLFGEGEKDPKSKLAVIYRDILQNAPRSNTIDSNLLKKYGIDNQNGTMVYEHAIEQRRTLSLIPSHVPSASPTWAIFCTDCFSLRTRIRGGGANKATESTILMKDGSHVCAACRGKNCIRVNVGQFYVTTLIRHIDPVPTVATTCGMCGYLSHVTNVIGQTPVCAACFSKSKEEPLHVTKKCCICTKTLSKRSYYMPVIAKTDNSDVARIHFVCSRCKSLQNQTGTPWNLSVLRILHREREVK